VRPEGLCKFKKSNDLIGNRSRDLPACSIAPQFRMKTKPATMSEILVPGIANGSRSRPTSPTQEPGHLLHTAFAVVSLDSRETAD
jgi:hypothetical protein